MGVSVVVVVVGSLQVCIMKFNQTAEVRHCEAMPLHEDHRVTEVNKQSWQEYHVHRSCCWSYNHDVVHL
jgi:hypothetical protein